MIDVNPNHLETIKRILAGHVPECEVRAFGSRVTWTAKDYSDLDLTIVAPRQLEPDVRRRLKEAFEESDLPFRVDVIDWHAISKSFRKVIEKQYDVVQRGGRTVGGEWAETTLGNVIELKRGYDLPQRERIPGSVPLVSSSGVTDHHSEAKIKGPGVVTGRYGTLGQVFFVRNDFWPLNTTLYVHDFKGNDPRFVGYFLRSLDFLAYSDKAAVPGLNRNHLHQAEVRIPSDIAEQRAIAHILGTLDDKIELNRRMSETLEAMARALFQSWFVDFDPVRAKAEGCDPGLPQPLADLFPARLVDSELGEIPEGWEAPTFGDVVEPVRDNENPLASPGVVFQHFSIPAFDDGQWPKTEFGENIKSQKLRVPPGVVLLSKLNPEIERVWLVDVEPDDRAVCSTEFVVLRPRLPFGRSYAYCLARSPVFRRELEGLVTGTSKNHQRAQVGPLLGLIVVRPPGPLATTFEREAGPLLERTLECRRESRTLAALRDTLLPRLISGDLRVKDAEKFIGRAV
jgi:type I restriction enzyme S subunit